MKILLFDIESSPNIGYTWGRYEQTVIEFIKERQAICISWSWYPDPKVYVLALPDFPGYKKNPDSNKALISAFHKEISKADIAIGHNIDKFDDPMVNTDFIVNGLPPPPPHRTIDTLQIARRRFRFNGNRLGDLGSRLGLGKKVKHWGFELWRRCLAGDMKAWALMKRYNVGDVRLLRKVYLKLRPWMKNHPNLSVEDGSRCCPTCRSKDLKPWSWMYTQSGKYQRHICKSCGNWCKAVMVKGGVVFRPV